jgi:hypothetical protein
LALRMLGFVMDGFSTPAVSESGASERWSGERERARDADVGDGQRASKHRPTDRVAGPGNFADRHNVTNGQGTQPVRPVGVSQLVVADVERPTPWVAAEGGTGILVPSGRGAGQISKYSVRLTAT